jgi:hypothetical protein
MYRVGSETFYKYDPDPEQFFSDPDPKLCGKWDPDPKK